MVSAALLSCGGSTDDADGRAAAQTSPPSDGVTAPATLAPTVDATSTSAVPPPVDPAAVDSCLTYVQLKRFLGDPAGAEIWDRAGGSDEALVVECSRLASVDPAGVSAMRTEVDAINAYLEAAAQATTTTSTTTTTTQPPPPPTTLPRIVPVFDPGECDPNYSGCVPVASDVDCAGGSGNGPAYVDGPVRVIGSDIYGLDGNDNDGIGCES
jgi:hypothetical protein